MIVSKIWSLNTRGKWGDEDDMDKEASFANLVRDRYDDNKFAILWNFSSDDDLIMRGDYILLYTTNISNCFYI